MIRVVLALGLGLSTLPARADFVDTLWRVTDFVGEAWFVEPAAVIGKTQDFYKGWAEGVFYACDYLGQSMTYTRFSMDDFLADPAYADFAPAAARLRSAGEVAFVHRITCEGRGDPALRRVLFPFVTTETREAAFYLFEGGVFLLRNDRPGGTPQTGISD